MFFNSIQFNINKGNCKLLKVYGACGQHLDGLFAIIYAIIDPRKKHYNI